MGMFSWKTSDTKKNIYTMKKPCYLLIPEEFGGCWLREDDYDGYGHFESSKNDVYELVADWNREYVTENNLRKPTWTAARDTESYIANMKRYHKRCRRLQDFKNGVPDDRMEELYGRYWKRSIGIDIACYDEQNAALVYPIKIVEDKNISYNKAKPSKGCDC